MAVDDESILDSVKEYVGIVPADTSFDKKIKPIINAAFAELHQIGVGPADSFRIESNAEPWSAFIGTQKNISNVKTYVGMYTQLRFDPPPTSYAVTSTERMLEEDKWRLQIECDKS